MLPAIQSWLLIFAIPLMIQAQLSSLSLYRIDPGRSRVQLDVFRGGILKTFGHDHKVAARIFSGTVQFDPAKLRDSSVSLSIESNSLIVLDPNTSEDERNEVQAAMGSPKVLDIQKFSKITFNSTRVAETMQKGDNFEIQLTGRLHLHGMEKEIAFPVRISLERNLLRATGTADIAQTDFGIVPIKLAGGTVRVKDRVKVTFDFLAERASGL
jgi:polyisoprenoid-binding protein YceI